MIIEIDGLVIGTHGITDIKANESAVMHAHIFDANFRRAGVCSFTYPRAALVFMDQFNLPKIVFKTPLQNVGAQRVKEKLGITCIGQELIENPNIIEGTMAKVYELGREQALGIIATTAGRYREYL